MTLLTLIALGTLGVQAPCYADSVDDACADTFKERDKTTTDQKKAGEYNTAAQKDGRTTIITPTQSSSVTQRLQYCDTAKKAQDAADTQSVLWKVWAGVAAVCATTCATSLSGVYANQWICAGTNAAGIVTDGVMTKQYQAALTQLTTSLVGLGMNYMANSDKGKSATPEKPANEKAPEKSGDKAAEPEEKVEKDYNACLTAAAAGFQVYAKHSAMSDSEKSVSDTIAEIKRLNPKKDETDKTATTQSGGAFSIGTPAGQVAQGAVSTGSSDTSNAATSGTDNSSGSTGCGKAKKSGDSSALISCAVSSDSRLPQFVKTQKFQDDLKKSTGASLEDINNNAQSPQSLMPGLMGNALGVGSDSAKAAQLAEALKKFENDIFESPTGKIAYAAPASGQSHSKASSNEPDFGSMMGGLMGGLFGNKGGAAGGKLNRSLDFSHGQAARMLAASKATFESRDVSLFDRVTHRYVQSYEIKIK